VRKEQPVTQTQDNEASREVIAQGALRGAGWNTPAMLVVKRGPNAGVGIPLYQAVATAGRDPRSDIFLDDVTVSRHHAEFRLERHELQVVDIGSLNGTYVNGQPIDSAVLTNGDEIQMGKFRLVSLIRAATG
jgi:pSer/pThr/pTyr-binding forkhead associated (FHA) protein